MEKYIHYCWFGGKPLPKLAKKCIKSWKKFLPDYKIIRWDETNTDLNECPFVKGAFENKKWAFVADYARTKAIKEYGGIYFDTDMIIDKDISHLLDKNEFLGIEDSGLVNAAVWYAKEKNSKLSTELLNFYQSQSTFDIDNIYSLAIPNLITNIINHYGFSLTKEGIQELDHGITIYPRDYFYPLSYDFQDNRFSENTCMIHYYLATWVPKYEQKEIKIYRRFGTEKGKKIVNILRFFKRNIKRSIKLVTYPIYKSRTKKNANVFFENRLNDFKSKVDAVTNNDYLIICHNDWLGVKSSSMELFGDVCPVYELYDGDKTDLIAKHIVSKKFKLVVFSAFAKGWENLAINLRKYDKDLKIKVFWHGSNAMHMEDYDWNRFNKIFELLKNNVVNSIAFAKKSMYEQYKKLGFNVEFLMNTVNIDKEKLNLKEVPKGKELKIGLYASGNRWVKNFYNQLCAASLIKNAKVDVLPLSDRIIEVSRLLNINLTGIRVTVPRDEMRRRIATNDIVLYTTFVECAPIIPLECMELGVLCITGNNHHYWEGTELEKYLVVSKVDNPVAIAEQAELCLKNKDKIFKLYKEWKKSYDKECEKNLKKFLND